MTSDPIPGTSFGCGEHISFLSLGPPSWGGTSHISRLCVPSCVHTSGGNTPKSSSWWTPKAWASLTQEPLSRAWAKHSPLLIFPGVEMTQVLCVQHVEGCREHLDLLSVCFFFHSAGKLELPGLKARETRVKQDPCLVSGWILSAFAYDTFDRTLFTHMEIWLMKDPQSSTYHANKNKTIHYWLNAWVRIYNNNNVAANFF